MASPTTAISRVEMSVGVHDFGLDASRRGFIAPQVLRPHPVSKPAGSFGNLPIEALLSSSPAQVRAPGSGYARDRANFGLMVFQTAEFGVEEPVDDSEAAAYSDILDQEGVAVSRCIDRILRPLEIAVAALLYDEAVWTGAALTSAASDWSDATNATPIDDVEAAAQKIFDGVGFRPNACTMNEKQFHACRRSDQVLERIVAGGGPRDPAVVSVEALSQILGVRVLLGSAAKNTATEGQAAVVAPIWSDDYCMVCRIATSDDLREPAIGRLIIWPQDGGGVGDGTELGLVIEEYRQEEIRSAIFRARTHYQTKLFLVAAGHLLTAVLGS